MSLWCHNRASASKVYFEAYKGIRFAIVALALTITSSCAVAAEWSAEPTVSLRQEYNDNINLSPLPHKAVWGTILSPSITFSGNSETLEVSGGAQLNFNRYTGAKGLDSDDRIFAFGAQYKNERNTWGLNVNSTRDSTHATEQVSTGIILPRSQRNALTVNPSWSHSFSDRISLHFEYKLNSVTYDNGLSVGLVDYKSKGGDVSMAYLLNDTDKVTISTGRSKSTSAGNSESTTDHLNLVYSHEFSETLHGDALVGVRKTTSKYFMDVYSCEGIGGYAKLVGSVYYCGFDFFGRFFFNPSDLAQLVAPRTSTKGSSFNLGLSKKMAETDLLTARLSRDINPSGRGLLVETDHLSLAYSRRFSDTLSGSINTDLYRTRNPAIANSGNQYFTIAPSLSWQLSEWWYLDSGVQYANQKFDGATTGVSSNLIYGSIRYNWPKISVSR